jgi:two-component system phosphate regulon sensor histidine kinase PhoR
LEYPLAQQGFELRLDVEESLPVVNADGDALQQAILNLLTNAMKYSGASREIDLRLHRQNGQAVIQVTDYGVGIAREEHAPIFENFYRVLTPESKLIPGAGLGLTLVAHVAKAHGGSVEVQSAPGEGSTFSICLPLETWK